MSIDFQICISVPLNIHNLRNKVSDLGEILKDLLLDYLVISETKLDET